MLIELAAVRKSFGRGPRGLVLDGLDLAVPRGEFLAVRGESGIGKSTLLNLIAGLDRPDAGRVVVDGVDLAGLDDDALTRLRRERIGFVFQAFHVLPYLTVAQNVALPLALLGRSDATAAARVGEMLAAVGLAERGDALPRELSGGEVQRVAIARALVHRPAVVLADEPTGNLDSATGQAIMALIDELNGEGATIVVITHEHEIAAHFPRQISLLDGRIVSDRRRGEAA